MSEVKDQTLFTELLNIVSASKQNGVFLVREISDALASMGYRKVVECGKCKYWHPRGNDGDIRTGYCTQGYEPLGWEVSEYSEYHFCSAGEPKEGVND
jgi:hypothetical protein